MSNLTKALVALIIQQRNLSEKEEKLSNDLEKAQNCKDTVAIDNIGAQYDELENELVEVVAAETIMLDKLVEESDVDFYQN
jgi:nucleoside-triphosphatase THEP1